MKKILTSVILIYSFALQAQSTLEWDGKYQLLLSDFQSVTTQVGEGSVYSVYSPATFEFAFAMTNAEFAFTKNFNPKVTCTFDRTAASLIAPDSSFVIPLLSFARYQFDLAELYARKLRKRLYEDKKTFSRADFFKPAYEAIRKEFTDRFLLAAKESDLGRNSEILQRLHQSVRDEIELLSDFCKDCKVPKKQK